MFPVDFLLQPPIPIFICANIDKTRLNLIIYMRDYA